MNLFISVSFRVIKIGLKLMIYAIIYTIDKYLLMLTEWCTLSLYTYIINFIKSEGIKINNFSKLICI